MEAPLAAGPARPLPWPGDHLGATAIAHLRLRILSLLTGAEPSAAEVARELGVTQANASYHFRVLARAGEVVEALGLVLAAHTVPMVVLLLFGGVLADRFDRTRVILLTALLSALAQGTVAALLTRVRLPARTKPAESPSMVTELREGWSVFVGSTWLWVVVVAVGADPRPGAGRGPTV